MQRILLLSLLLLVMSQVEAQKFSNNFNYKAAVQLVNYSTGHIANLLKPIAVKNTYSFKYRLPQTPEMVDKPEELSLCFFDNTSITQEEDEPVVAKQDPLLTFMIHVPGNTARHSIKLVVADVDFMVASTRQVFFSISLNLKP